VLIQGGIDTGRVTLDTCEIRAQLPETAPVNPYCRTNQPTTQVKLIGSYTVPRVELQLSTTFQSIPGPEIAATYAAPNALIAPSLGRNLSGGAANASINLVEPGTMYGDRLNQLDLRFARAVRFGRTRTTLQFDIYNALNVDTIQTVNNTFGPLWQRPQTVILARFMKFGVQLDF
jgi:hypothetical protein